jgi:hypothetical protein
MPGKEGFGHFRVPPEAAPGVQKSPLSFKKSLKFSNFDLEKWHPSS